MSSVDQLFDRFGDLLRSWTAPGSRHDGRFQDPGRNSSRSSGGDPFLDEAMAELDAFLDDDKEEQERLRREAEARQRAYDNARQRAGASAGASAGTRASGPPAKLLSAYKTLGLSYGASFDQVKTAYKRLLKAHHPDRHGSDPEAQKKATETSARLNNAFRIIETWNDTGTLGDE